MSRISENIRKITKAWGGKTTGNGISDALSDLYNNLPFGTKVETVEILEEQNTVAYSDLDGNEQSKGGITKFVDIANGTVCYVTINDVVFKGVAERGEFGDTTGNLCVQVVICDNPENPTFFVQLFNDNAKAVFGVEVNGFAVIVNGDNAINAETLSISTEQETVTPIPQKYLPEHLQFGVKTEMVEIVPEQSVTEIDGEYFITSPFELEDGKTYKVVINDVLYEGEAVETLDWVSIHHELFSVHNYYDEEKNTYGTCYFNDMTPVKTIAIYEEQEVVKQLDINFLPIEELKQALGLNNPV